MGFLSMNRACLHDFFNALSSLKENGCIFHRLTTRRKNGSETDMPNATSNRFKRFEILPMPTDRAYLALPPAGL
jgi:hypothetical protein